MKTVSLDTRKELRPVERAPMVGPGFGQAPLNALQKQLGVMQQISEQTAAEGTQYMLKNKHADMVADALAYETEAQRLTSEADQAARATSDPKEVERIYRQAQENLDKWISGKSRGGAPNIRWEDQLVQIKGDAEKRRVGFNDLKNRRQSQISIADTNAKSEQAILQGLRTNNAELIRDGIGAMVLNGTLTTEQGELRAKQETIKAEQHDATMRVNAIADLNPDRAAEKAQEYLESIKDGFYKELTGDEVEAIRSGAEKAVEQAKSKELYRNKQAALQQQQQRIEQANASADALVKLWGSGTAPTLESMRQSGMTPEHVARVVEQIGPDLGRDKQLELAESMGVQIAGYDRNSDELGGERVDITTALMQLDQDLRGPLKKLWELKTTPGKETQALGAQRIFEVVGKKDKNGNFDGGEKQFQWIEKKGNNQIGKTKREFLLSTTLDRFNQFVESGPHTDAEIINWVYADPYISSIRQAENAAEAKKAYGRPVVKPQSTMPRIGGAQAIYVEDKTFSILEGVE